MLIKRAAAVTARSEDYVLTSSTALDGLLLPTAAKRGNARHADSPERECGRLGHLRPLCLYVVMRQRLEAAIRYASAA